MISSSGLFFQDGVHLPRHRTKRTSGVLYATRNGLKKTRHFDPENLSEENDVLQFRAYKACTSLPLLSSSSNNSPVKLPKTALFRAMAARWLSKTIKDFKDDSGLSTPGVF
jgi:hypothetical protein